MNLPDNRLKVSGLLLLGWMDACRNLGIIAGDKVKNITQDINPHDWYPLSHLFDLTKLVAETYVKPGAIYEEVGKAMMVKWYEFGPGKDLVKGGIDFLKFQSGAEGFSSVIRGPIESIGKFELTELDESKGYASIYSSTPFNRYMEKGVIIGGMSAPGDIDYLDVNNDSNENHFTIHFHVSPKKLTKNLGKILESSDQNIAEMIGNQEMNALVWKYKGIQKDIERTNAFWEASNATLSTAYEKLDRESAELLRATFNATANGILVTGKKGTVSHWNKKFADMWSIPKHILDTRDYNQFVEYVLDQLETPDAFLNMVAKLNKDSGEQQEKIKFKDGRVFEYYSCPLIKEKIEAGRVWDFRDITEQKQAEDKLNQAENTIRNIINSMPSVLIGVDQEVHVTQWNHEAEKVTGIKTQEAIGNHLEKIFPQLTGEMEDVKTAIQERQIHKSSKVRVEEKDEIRYMDVTVYPLVSDNPEGAVIRVDDVTERTRIEEMIIQTEKIISIGGLAAGMAHEINNPISGILQTMQVMQKRLFEYHPKNNEIAEGCDTTFNAIRSYMEKLDLRRMINTVMESGDRAANIINNMLSFSRKSELKFALNHLDQIMDKAIKLVESDYDLKKKFNFHNMEIVREYDDSIPTVLCEGIEIQQVFFNILKNGVQAMMDNTKPIAKDFNKVELPRFILRIQPDYEAVRVEIEDNGPGMDEEISNRVFEPFFTTKDVGKGTGLGLSVSYFIITENHGGTLWVDSAPGLGTRFTILLPIKTSNGPNK